MPAVETVEPLVTMSTAARQAGIPYRVLLRLVRAQKIRSVDIGGTIRVRVSDVQAVIRVRGESAQPVGA